ncbi:MAG: DegV family protein [Lachnospiraceae bacterium]
MEQIQSENKEKIAIITDSCADIPKELQEKYHIFVLPMMISCRDGEYRDGIDIHAEDIYERLKTELPKTSTPTGESGEKLFIQLKEEGYDKAVALMISSGISSTVNYVRLAAKDAEFEVCAIDSLSGSIGNGAIALQTAIWRDEGVCYEELCKRAARLCDTTTVFFSIDTLEYLEKGGRIGKATAFLGSTLNIKPILSFDKEGEIYTPAKVRGRKLVEKKLLSLVEEQVSKPENAGKRYNIMVADGGVPEEREALECKMKELFPDYLELFRAKIGAALSTYLGPGLLGAGIQFLDE